MTLATKQALMLMVTALVGIGCSWVANSFNHSEQLLPSIIVTLGFVLLQLLLCMVKSNEEKLWTTMQERESERFLRQMDEMRMIASKQREAFDKNDIDAFKSWTELRNEFHK